jgi:hypothetical protein
VLSCPTHRMTWTCALMTRVSDTVNPSSTLDSSMNFFHPQSCSFLQKRCSVSGGGAQAGGGGGGGGPRGVRGREGQEVGGGGGRHVGRGVAGM